MLFSRTKRGREKKSYSRRCQLPPSMVSPLSRWVHLPLGGRDDVPSYDYAEGLTLKLYRMTDGGRAVRRVCDTAGQEFLRAEAVRSGNTITISLTGAVDVSVEQIGTDCRIELLKDNGE